MTSQGVRQEQFEDAAGDAQPPTQKEAGDHAPASGFRLQLDNANLHNLLQVEHLSRSNGVFTVSSNGRVGQLHLNHGELTHAQCGALEGEAAALHILSWGEGTIADSQTPISNKVTVSRPLAALLLSLAQQSDEEAFEEHCATAEPSHLERKPSATTSLAPSRATANSGTQRSLTPHDRSVSDHSIPTRCIAEVQLSTKGQVLVGRGAGVEALAGRVSYAARMGLLVGEALCSGTPVQLVAKGKTTRTVVQWQSTGELGCHLELAQQG